MSQISPGDAILWKGRGLLFIVLSFILGLFYPDWRKRQWKPWHVGFVVKVFEDGSLVTCEAIAKGISFVEYDSPKDLGYYRSYRWLDEAGEDIEDWASEHIGLPYDPWVYLFIVASGICMKIFKRPFRIVNRSKMCWENLSEFYRSFGKELQPAEEPPLINKIINTLENR